jgi:SsrA-binding protein
MATKAQKNIEIKNRKASYEYEFIETYTAGMVLTGTEIKSIRLGKANLSDAYCFINDGELYIKNLNIAVYDFGTVYNHEPLRERKLLLNKRELRKIEGKLKDTGLTVIPTKLFISENGFAKLNIALGKGKKLYDKRQSLKAKDVQKIELKNY